MLPPLTVRPIVFTPQPDRWRHLLAAAGGTTIESHDGWWVVAMGSGRVGIHAVPADGPAPGPDSRWVLGFETPDLDAFARAARDGVEHAGGTIAVARAGHGTQLRVTGPDGLTFGIDEAGEPAGPSHTGRADAAGPTVAPLWMTDDVEGATALLEALGLERRLASDSGGWVDLVAADGLHAVHANGTGTPTEPSAVPGFEHADVDALAALLRRSGVTSRIIDEAYGRSLRIDDPDSGREIWVNETMRDLYGYSGGRDAAPGGAAEQ